MSLWGHVIVGSMSVVPMLLWVLHHSVQQVSGGQVHYGGHVTLGSRSVVAMSLWGHVTVVSM